MSHRATTAINWNATTRRLSILLVVALLASVPGLLAADVAAAQQGVERNGQNVVIDLPETDDEIETVELTVETVDGLSYGVKPGNGSETAVIDTTMPSEGSIEGVSLTNETVTVTFRTENGVLGNETVSGQLSMHTVGFETELPVWIADDTVRLPLNESETVGVVTNDSLTVSVGDQQLSGTVLYGDQQLAIDRAELAAAGGTGEFSVDVLAETSARSVAASGPREFGTEIRANDDGLVVWSPLFESATEYDIEATDTEDNSYDATTGAVAPGQIALPGLAPGEIEVTVSEGGTTLVNRTGEEPVSYGGPLTVGAAVGDDGTTLEFDQSLAGLSVTGVAVDPETGPARYTAIDDEIGADGQLAVDEPVAVEDQLLVSSGAGVAAVSLRTAAAGSSPLVTLPNNPLPIGLAFTVPLLIGAVVGGFGIWSQKQPTTGNKLVIGGLGLALGLASAGGVLLATTGLQPVSLGHVGGGVGTLLGAGMAVGLYWWRGSKTADSNGVYSARIELRGYDQSQGGITVERRKPGDPTWQSETVHTDVYQANSIGNSETWEVRARRGTKTSPVKTISRQSPDATLTVPGQKTITVTDPNGEPIANTTVRIDADTGGKTGQDGSVTVTLPGDATSVEAELSHDKYESKTATLQVGSQHNPTVTLSPRTGELRIVTRVDGVQTESVPVEVVPDENALSELYSATETTTGSDGEFTESVMIGQYRVSSALPVGGSAFRGDAATVTVREGSSVTAEIDLQFTGQLTADHRERIDQIRADVRSLGDSTGQDTAIQQYYGSVVESMLEAAESVPDSGHLFVGRQPEPGVVIDTLLTMAATTTGAITDAMTTKRNVDLFAACSDMPVAAVSWSGTCDLAELLDRLEQFETNPTANRREVKERYEAVSERIETERAEVAEISPVLEMHKQAWEMVDQTDHRTDAVGTRYGSLLLLDAVESLFDHDPLRERLSRTVF